MESDMREWTYRHYVASSLRAIPQNQYMKESLVDLLKPQKIDIRTGDEVINDVMAGAGLHWSEE